LDLESKSDSEIWQYAKDNGFVIVSRDSDFQERSLVAGHPPQVIWLKIPITLNILLDHHQEIVHALTEQQLACVELSHRNK
jgi:predicted nuclease of predicted toxin-antitoxin system